MRIFYIECETISSESVRLSLIYSLIGYGIIVTIIIM